MIEISGRFILGDKEICDMQTGEVLSAKADLVKHLNRSLNKQKQERDPLQEKQLFLAHFSEEKQKNREEAMSSN